MNNTSEDPYFRLSREVREEEKRKKKSVAEKVIKLRPLSIQEVINLQSKYKQEEKEAFRRQLYGPRELDKYHAAMEWREACDIVLEDPDSLRTTIESKSQKEQVADTNDSKERKTSYKELTKEAVKYCYQEKKKNPHREDRAIAREAVDKFFPELTGVQKIKKIDSIRKSFTAKLNPPKKKHLVKHREAPIASTISIPKKSQKPPLE